MYELSAIATAPTDWTFIHLSPNSEQGWREDTLCLSHALFATTHAVGEHSN